MPPAILKTILEHKKKEVALLKKQGGFAPRSAPRRSFLRALREAPYMGLIAEVKKGSPSKGIIRPDFDPVAIARAYQSGGAHAVSVLTDKHFFMGDPGYLVAIRRQVSLPVLRKEFIIDPLQIEQSASLNADAVLLIAAALSDGQIQELYDAAVQCDLEPLVEIHSGAELDRAMKLSPALLGINNRNLDTFEVSLATTVDLMHAIPDDVTVVSESGVETGEHTALLRSAGARAVLVGESLMRRTDPQPLIQELVHAAES